MTRREQIARIVDPTAFEPMTGHTPHLRQADALAKADQIMGAEIWSDDELRSASEKIVEQHGPYHWAYTVKGAVPTVFATLLFFRETLKGATHE